MDTNEAAQAADDFDLGNFRSVDTAELVMKHPVTGAPTKWVWTIAGPAHPETKALATRQARRAQLDTLALQRRGRQKATDLPDPDEGRNQFGQDLAARVLNWPSIKLNGETLVFSKDKTAEILNDPAYGWVVTQLVEFLTADSVFMPSSAKDS